MAANKNLGMDVGTSGGDWLFRQGELVLGPIPAKLLVDKLYSGEVDGKTYIARMGQSDFKRLAEVDFFHVHLAKAEAKHRVDALAQQDRAKNARVRNIKIGIVAGISVVVATCAGIAAWYLAIHKPWQDADELAFADISVEAPTISLANTRANSDDFVDYPSGDDGKGRRVNERIAERAKGTSDRGSDHAGTARAERPSRPAKVGEEDPEGMKTESFDRSAINSVVAAKQRTLYPCLVEEAKKKPGLVAKIPIEFVIGNDGRVTKVWVDHPDFKTGSLPECLLRELQKWPFHSYQGEQATVGLSFNIGKKG